MIGRAKCDPAPERELHGHTGHRGELLHAEAQPRDQARFQVEEFVQLAISVTLPEQRVGVVHRAEGVDE